MFDLLSWFSITMETLAALTFFEALFDCRFRRRCLMYLAIPISIICLSLVSPLLPSPKMSPLFSILILFLLTNILFRGSFWKKLIYTLLVYLIIFGTDLLIIGLFLLFTELNYSDLLGGGVYSVFLGVMSKIPLFVLSKVFYHFRRQKQDNLHLNDWILVLFVPLTTLVTVLSLMWDSAMQNNISSWTVIALIMLMLLNVILFIIIDRLSAQSRMQTENRLLEQQIALEKKNLSNLTETHQQIRSLSHDFRNHLSCVKGLLEIGEYQKAEAYINTIAVTSNQVLLPISTKNMTVDAILNQKFQLASSKNIRMQFQVSDLSDLKISDMDLVTILANILDNAIEAAEQTEGNGLIQVKLIQDATELLIAVKNPVKERIAVSGSETKSSKSNPSGHGIGLKNVRAVLKKYKSDYNLSCDGQEFSFLAIIQNFS